jgi:hypothetical protein
MLSAARIADASAPPIFRQFLTDAWADSGGFLADFRTSATVVPVVQELSCGGVESLADAETSP